VTTENIARTPDVVPVVEAAGRRNAVLDYAANYWRKVAGGDMGALPAVGGLIVLCTFFALARPSRPAAWR